MKRKVNLERHFVNDILERHHAVMSNCLALITIVKTFYPELHQEIKTEVKRLKQELDIRSKTARPQ